MTENKPHNVAPMLLAMGLMNMCVIGLVVYFGLRPQMTATPAVTSENAMTSAKVEPLVQTDAVSPGSKFTGQVFYPIPYGSPPNLRLICDDKKRVVEITKEDELGFVWMIRPALDDIAEATAKAAAKPEDLLRFTFDTYSPSNFKPNLQFADFKYEAKGVTGGGRVQRPHEQTGQFTTAANTEGEVIYPIPYAQPANVQLSTSGPGSYVVVVESRANGFKWKNKVEKTWENFASGSVTWTAKGMRDK